MSLLKISFLLAFVFLALSEGTHAQNLKAEEILSKHFDSIGTSERRAELSSVMALGSSEFESRNPKVEGGGKAIIVSNPNNLFFIISLNSREYPFEKIGYFQDRVSLPFISPGLRSTLGTFVAEHERMLSAGIFGGSTSLRWVLALSEKNKPKVKAAGTKKVNGRSAHVIEYLDTGGPDFKIKMFFDAETFRHVRTEYRRETPVRQGTFGQQNQQQSSIITLTEDFSDYRTVDGVTLPYIYGATYVSNSSTTSNENAWRINVAEYRLNQKLQPDFFTFEAK